MASLTALGDTCEELNNLRRGLGNHATKGRDLSAIFNQVRKTKKETCLETVDTSLQNCSSDFYKEILEHNDRLNAENRTLKDENKELKASLDKMIIKEYERENSDVKIRELEVKVQLAKIEGYRLEVTKKSEQQCGPDCYSEEESICGSDCDSEEESICEADDLDVADLDFDSQFSPAPGCSKRLKDATKQKISNININLFKDSVDLDSSSDEDNSHHDTLDLDRKSSLSPKFSKNSSVPARETKSSTFVKRSMMLLRRPIRAKLLKKSIRPKLLKRPIWANKSIKRGKKKPSSKREKKEKNFLIESSTSNDEGSKSQTEIFSVPECGPLYLPGLEIESGKDDMFQSDDERENKNLVESSEINDEDMVIDVPEEQFANCSFTSSTSVFGSKEDCINPLDTSNESLSMANNNIIEDLDFQVSDEDEPDKAMSISKSVLQIVENLDINTDMGIDFPMEAKEVVALLLFEIVSSIPETSLRLLPEGTMPFHSPMSPNQSHSNLCLDDEYVLLETGRREKEKLGPPSTEESKRESPTSHTNDVEVNDMNDKCDVFSEVTLSSDDEMFHIGHNSTVMETRADEDKSLLKTNSKLSKRRSQPLSPQKISRSLVQYRHHSKARLAKNNLPGDNSMPKSSQKNEGASSNAGEKKKGRARSKNKVEQTVKKTAKPVVRASKEDELYKPKTKVLERTTGTKEFSLPERKSSYKSYIDTKIKKNLDKRNKLEKAKSSNISSSKEMTLDFLKPMKSLPVHYKIPMNPKPDTNNNKAEKDLSKTSSLAKSQNLDKKKPTSTFQSSFEDYMSSLDEKKRTEEKKKAAIAMEKKRARNKSSNDNDKE